MKFYPAEKLILAISFVILLINLGIHWAKGIQASVEHYALPYASALFLLLIGQLLRRWSQTQSLALFVQAFSLVFFVSPQAANLIFLVLPLNHMAPVDGTLVWLDSLLWSSWPAWCAWLANNPELDAIVRPVYFWTVPSVLACFFFLAMAFDIRNLQRVQLSLVLGLFLTIACWTAFPSAGASAYWQLDPAINAVLKPVVDSEHGATIVRLMNEGVPVLGVMDMRGMIGFPSYHATIGTLLAFGLWPYRVSRLLIVPLVPILTIGIITHGGHSLMDFIGGFIVALVAWFASIRLLEGNPLTTRSVNELDPLPA